MTGASPDRYIRPGIAVFVVLVFWVIGYYPFDYGAPSKFNWASGRAGIEYVNAKVNDNSGVTSDAGGLHFIASSIAYMPEPPGWLPEAIKTSALDLSLTIKTSAAGQSGPARIFTISKNTAERDLTVGQDGPDLVIRVRTSKANPNGLPELKVEGVFSEPVERHIAVSIVKGSMKVFVDDKEAVSVELPEDALSLWSADYLLALGNELDFSRPWLGDIFEAAVTVNNRAVDFAAAGALETPVAYRHEETKKFVASPLPARDDLGADLYKDVLLNFFGFFALGVLIIYLGGRSATVIVATVACALLSLSIEAGQVFLVDRHPSSTDLVLNTVGGLIGAGLAGLIRLPALPFER